jgi:phosphate transport system substrate-binding protein
VEILGVEVTGADGSVRDMTTIDAIIASGTSTVITTVAGDTYAIGYISLGSLNDAATAENVQNGSYSLFRTFYIAAQENTSALTQDFINFILSEEGQTVVSQNYVVSEINATNYIGGENLSGTIVVSGSTSVAPLMERLKEAYEAIHSGVTVEVHASGSSAGINAAISGLAEIGMSSRELRASELEELNALAIAFDGLAVIVNNENPTTNMTNEQIRRIFVGDITQWNEIE